MASTRAAAVLLEVAVVRPSLATGQTVIAVQLLVAALEIVGLLLGILVPVWALLCVGAAGRRFSVNLVAFLLVMAGAMSAGGIKHILDRLHPTSLERIPFGQGWSYIAFTDPQVPLIASLVLLVVYLGGAALWWRPATSTGSDTGPGPARGATEDHPAPSSRTTPGAA
ncbi:hypothetical protein [Brachybacterium phenoliresistens]|uniref:hypothetical protein n=1 Tax=Brachybacterium phenoliresistens TaxID=396014 RepID=UPI0012EC0A54|nr:hypothetical protein [Brachybacterium phenoliresistens]